MTSVLEQFDTDQSQAALKDKILHAALFQALDLSGNDAIYNDHTGESFELVELLKVKGLPSYLSNMIHEKSGDLIKYNMCQDCTDIVIQGYSDGITNTDIHQSISNRIDRLPPTNQYWLSGAESIPLDISCKCEGCNKMGVSFVCRSRVSGEK